MTTADLTIVEIAFGQGPYTLSPTWTNVTSVCDMASWTGGRTDPTQLMSAKTASFTLDNRDGDYDPFAVTTLRPNIPVRISVLADGNLRRRFYGFVNAESINWGWPEGGQVTFTATDATKFLARETNLGLGDVPAERTDARFARVLDAVGIPSAWREIGDAGRVMVAAEMDSDASSAVGDCVRTEGLGSCMFVTAAGKMRLDDRHPHIHRTSLRTVQATFSTLTADSTAIRYSQPQAGFSETAMFNKATASNASGDVASATDATSVTAHGPVRAPDISLSSYVGPSYDADVIVALFADPLAYISSITVSPASDDANFDILAQLELRDRVRVKLQRPGGSVIDQECSIEQISETSSRGSLWRATYTLFPLERFDSIGMENWLVLDSATRGLLGTNTLAY